VAFVALLFISGKLPNFPGKDSNAQLAYYTLWLMIFTGALAVTSTIQIAFLTRADQANKKSSEASARAANAAARNSKALLMVERAYVFAGVGKIVSGKEKGNSATIYMRMRNTGKTPARIIGILFESLADAPKNPIPSYVSNEYVIDNIVPADDLFHFGPTNVTVPCVVAGYIRYIDVFKSEHISRICIRLNEITTNPEGELMISTDASGPSTWNDWD
jgi:hypothetical protein